MLSLKVYAQMVSNYSGKRLVLLKKYYLPFAVREEKHMISKDVLLDAVKCTECFTSFIGNLAYNDVLRRIDDQPFKTAQEIALGLPNSKEKSSLIQNIIAVLESAHAKYADKTAIGSVIKSEAHVLDARKDLYTCLVLSACYLYVGQRHLMDRKLEEAKAAADREAKAWLALTGRNVGIGVVLHVALLFLGGAMAANVMALKSKVDNIIKIEEKDIDQYTNGLAALYSQLYKGNHPELPMNIR
jgi:hypothetical protein